ncbi:glycoside hydrolase family 3 N-terminal domain-containing protein, partial [Tardisphaera saccharovorans]
MLSSNRSTSEAERIRSMIAQMTVEEKVAQIGAVRAISLTENGSFSEEKARKFLSHGIGFITRLTGDGLTIEQARDLVKKAQDYISSNATIKIPALIMEECLAGVKAPGATSFPQAIGLASTWDISLISRVASAIGAQASSLGITHCLSPVLDLAVDPRWGRTEETYGEDPYLVSSMGVAYVSSLQAQGVAATGKHFAGHGSSEGGRNTAPVNVSERFLRENHLRTFEAAVKEANMKSVMAAYHQLDGIPCHINHWLLRRVLREEWGFDGVVLSDGGGIPRLINVDYVASDCQEAAVKALAAGVDSEMPESTCYHTLIAAVTSGKIPVSILDSAVEEVLREKFWLGLLDESAKEVREAKLDDEVFRRVALEAARESIVLLKNDGTLPLKKGIKLTVVGPNAADQRNLFGDYHYTAHLGLSSPDVRTESILDAIRARNSSVLYAKGCDVALPSKDGFGQALE